MLATYGYTRSDKRVEKAVQFIFREQESDGSWFGRWGVNYIYGTFLVLRGLDAIGVDHHEPQIQQAAEWIRMVQNPDGGWGESCASYDRGTFVSAPSTPSQTAWALLGLMAAGEAGHPAVARGVEYLLATQEPGGLWSERDYTGTGFPRVFYLRYHGYPKYFPLWAVARFRNLKNTNSRKVAFGL